MKPITTFKGGTRELSNSFGGPVEFEGKMYKSAEAAFQAAKTYLDSQRTRFMIMPASQARWEGRKLKLRSDWEHVKTDIMKTILIDKFSRNVDARALLLATADAHLEAGNNDGDKIWGTVDGVGENRLGIILMEIRDMIRIILSELHDMTKDQRKLRMFDMKSILKEKLHSNISPRLMLRRPKGDNSMKPFVRGDYVLATKYPDGDPCDHFYVGFFREMLVDVNGKTTDRFLVDDGKGQLARANGFRRCERISQRVGTALCAALPIIGGRTGKSVWWWRRHVKALEQLVSAN